MPGGYPPAFLFAKKGILKMFGGFPPAFLTTKNDTLKNAWWVSTILFKDEKTL